MKASTRIVVMGAFSLLGLLLGYGVILCFYVAGLFGDGTSVSARAWERALRGTILMGPFLGAFVLMGFLAWRERWRTGLLPWATGAAGVVLLARRDAGILATADIVLIIPLLIVAGVAGGPDKRNDDDAEKG